MVGEPFSSSGAFKEIFQPPLSGADPAKNLKVFQAKAQGLSDNALTIMPKTSLSFRSMFFGTREGGVGGTGRCYPLAKSRF